MKRLAIIGASTGQLPLCLKAKELGYETYCFAWPKNAVCKDVVDYFIPISILEKDEIVSYCRDLKIDGVVSNASELTAEIVAYIAEKLNLPGPSYRTLLELHDKFYVRNLIKNIEGLQSPLFYKYNGIDYGIYPCVVKPCIGKSKIGVSFVRNADDFNTAIEYAQVKSSTQILVEEYIDGKEISVESISYKGKHYVIQITDKDSSSAPHFVELGHHQPANLSEDMREKIKESVSRILDAISYNNGASHIELKYKKEQLFLIEVNLRGGGDCISNTLVYLSSGVDYLKCMIDVALGIFVAPKSTRKCAYAGIYYLCKQTEYLLPFFRKAEGKEWLVEKEIYSTDLQESHSNYERNGFLIYCCDHKIIPTEL